MDSKITFSPSQPQIETTEWRHKACRSETLQQIPIEGGEVICVSCGDEVLIQKKQPVIKPKSKKKTSQHTWNDLGNVSPPQGPAFIEHPGEIHRVSPQKTLQSHFMEYSRLRMVMYVQRIDFITDLFDKYDMEFAQVIVGDSVVKKNRSASEPEVFLRLAELISEGKLEVRTPTKNRIFHEKWILAEKENEISDIFGTANLTGQGSGKKGKQSNQERIQKITGKYEESPRFQELEEKYQWYLDNSEPYLDDLVNLLKVQETDENPPIEIVEQWISYTGSSTTGDVRKIQALVQEFQEAAIKDSLDPDQLVTTITTTASDAVLNEIVNILGSSGVQREGRTITASTRQFLQQRVATFPLMTIINDKVVLQVGAQSSVRTAEDYDKEAIKNGLHGIHQYVETIDKASVKNNLIAKKTMYEVILYFLTSRYIIIS